MATDIERWARTERQFIREEMQWFKAGARLLSPSGDDISDNQVKRLEARLEHTNKVLADDDRSQEGGN